MVHPNWRSGQRGHDTAIFAALLSPRQCEQAADDSQGGRQPEVRNASVGEQGSCTPAPAIAALAIALADTVRWP